MRKILMGLIITGFALVLFITIKPQVANLVVMPEAPAAGVSDGQVVLEPAPYFSVIQGESELALYVRNYTQDVASFSLGHEHAFLTFRPQGARLAAGSTREVFVHVDPECPVGEIELPVYLRAEVNGVRVGEDTVILLNVIPGELSLEYDRYGLKVLWNGEPAPRGAYVYYRPPGHNEWQLWGETPRTGTPAHLDPGEYEFEFKAELGEAQSEVEKFVVIVEEVAAAADPEPEPDSGTEKGTAATSTTKEPEPEPEKPKEPPKPGTKEYLILINQMLNKEPGEKTEEKDEKPKEWFD